MRADALAMLGRLSGRTHEVLTAVALAERGRARAAAESTSEVRFRALSRAECSAYWDSGEPRDKAGGYAMQGRGAVFIEHLSGSYSGVMGLPLFETAQLLRPPALRMPAGAGTRGAREHRDPGQRRARARRAPRCSRTACVQEIHVERTSRRGLVSNLYKGRVSRVLPGMQAAFVEIGLERTAFLHAADIAQRVDDTLIGAALPGVRRSRTSAAW